MPTYSHCDNLLSVRIALRLVSTTSAAILESNPKMPMYYFAVMVAKVRQPTLFSFPADAGAEKIKLDKLRSS